MDIHSVRQELRTKSIYEIPLRVTYYARVSSESDEQLNSLGNQIKYYEDLIRRNAAWTFVPGYIDEGLSGISTKRRENFNRMIDDAARDKFDLVITKEISRFARNTLDSIRYTRELLADGVGVFFQNDNINTLDEDSELRLSIMSSIAQDELRKLSSRVKFGHQQAIKQNVVLGNSRIFGYKKDNRRLVIDEEQAPMVRELFELYATDEYSMKQLEALFWEKGYRNLNGKKIAHSTMSNMIANPKYKGYYVGNKVKVVDMFTKKQKFLPPEEWVMFKDETGEIVPAIVSEELWEQANAVLRRRSEDVKNRRGVCNHANLLTGKLVEGGVQLGDYVVPVEREVLAKASGEDTVVIGIRPENFQISDAGIAVDVDVVEETGADAYVYGTLSGLSAEEKLAAQQIVARVSARTPPQRGGVVKLAPRDADGVHFFSQKTELRLN